MSTGIMKKALLLLYERGHFTELVRVAHLLRQDENFEPIFLFSRMLVMTDEVARICHDENFLCLDPQGQPIPLLEIINNKNVSEGSGKIGSLNLAISNEGRENKIVALYKWLKRALPPVLIAPFDSIRRFFYAVTSFLNALGYLKARYSQVSSFLKKHGISLLVFAEDNVYFDSAVWIKAGHELKVNSLIIPYTISNSLEQAESAFYDSPLEIDTFLKKVLGKLLPRWVYVHKGKPLLRLPWYEIMIREWLHLSPPNPWMLNSGFADAIAVESKAMHKYYLQGGLQSTALKITGSLADDQLSEVSHHRDECRAKLMDELNLDPSLPIMLIALPPNQFPRSCEFTGYEELVNFMGGMTGEIKNWNVIIRPHPKQTQQDMLSVSLLESRITWKDTASLVPLSSIYVACASATIRWAIACGVPAINYDVYKYHYSDYRDVPGVLYTDDRDTFMQLFAKLTTDKGFYNEIATKQQQGMGNWGLLDGKSGQRIIDLMLKLSKK